MRWKGNRTLPHKATSGEQLEARHKEFIIPPLCHIVDFQIDSFHFHYGLPLEIFVEWVEMDISKRLFQIPCDPYKDQIVNDLLREVWGFSSPHAVPKAKAASCFNHYESLLSNRQILDDQNTNLRESESQSLDVRVLVGRLKKQVHHPIADIRKSIVDDSPSWLLNTHNLDTLDKVLQFCVRLWLFVKPDLADENATLQVAVRNSVSKFGAPSNSWLWMDFSAKTLMERGRFHITWTSDIAEHLTFASKSVIRVFSHASVIELYEVSAEG